MQINLRNVSLRVVMDRHRGDRRRARQEETAAGSATAELLATVNYYVKDVMLQ